MANNKVNFFIEFKQKGLEYVKKYKDEIKKLGQSAKDVSKNNSTFNKSLDETSKKTSKVSKDVNKLNKELKEGNKIASNFGKNLGIAIGVATTAVAAYSKRVIDTIDAQSKLAQKAGVSFEEFQGFAKAADLAGISVETLADKFFELNKTVQEAALGEGEGVKILNALNVDAVTLAKLRPEEQLRTIASEIKGLPDLEKKLVLDKLKIKDIELLINNLEQVDQINKELKDRGLLLSEQDAVNFENFNDQITIFLQNLQAFSAKFLSEFIPQFNEFLKEVNGNDSILNGQNAEDLAKSLIKIISAFDLLTKSLTTLSSGVQGASEPIVYFLFLLKEETEFAFKIFKEVVDKYATIIKNGALSDLFKSLTKDTVNFFGEFEKLKAKSALFGGIIAKEAGFEGAGTELVKYSMSLNKTSEQLTDVADGIELTTEKEIERHNINIENLKKEREERRKALDSQFGKRVEQSAVNITANVSDLKNSLDAYNKVFNDTLTKPDEKIIKDNTKKTAEVVTKSLGDNFEKQPSGAYQKLVNKLNKELEIAELKFKLNPDDKEIFIQDLKRIYSELEEVETLYGDQNSLLKVQLDYKQKIKELTDDSVRQESLRKEILAAQVSLLKESGNIVEATEIERQERLKEIDEQYTDLEEKAKLIDLTNKIFDIEQFKNNLSIAEKELDALQNKLDNTDYFNFEERARLEEQINQKTQERIELQTQLGIKQEETNKNYVFTVQRINKLNEELKNSFLDIFSDFVSGTKSAKEAFNDFATFFLKKISEMILEQLYLNTIGSYGSNKDSGLGGGFGSLFFNALSALPFFHTGGTVGVTQPLVQVPGITKGDESLAVLKRGEQVLTKNQQYNGNMQASNNIVENNIIIDSNSLAKSTLETQNGVEGVIKIIRKNKDQIRNILD